MLFLMWECGRLCTITRFADLARDRESLDVPCRLGATAVYGIEVGKAFYE
jgi:hypothetical protein